MSKDGCGIRQLQNAQDERTQCEMESPNGSLQAFDGNLSGRFNHRGFNKPKSYGFEKQQDDD